MQSLWIRLRVLKNFVQLVRNPNRTELIFEMIHVLSREKDSDIAKIVIASVFESSSFRKMYAEHYMPRRLDLNSLSALPSTTFGYAVYRHYTDYCLDVDLFPRFQAEHPLEYLSLRSYHDHDLWHVLLGYGTRVEEELAIQAFNVAQFRSPLGALIISGGLLHLLGRNPELGVVALKNVSDGYLRGRHAGFLLGLKLEDMFAFPLDHVRQICGLNPPQMNVLDAAQPRLLT